MDGDGFNTTSRGHVDETTERAIMAAYNLSWFVRHIGLFGGKGRHVGAVFKSVIWMTGFLIKIFQF